VPDIPPDEPPFVAELPMSSSSRLPRSVRPLWLLPPDFSLSAAPYPPGLLLEPNPPCPEPPLLDPPEPLERPLDPLEPLDPLDPLDPLLEPLRDDPTFEESSPMLPLRELPDEPLIPSP